MCEELEPDTPYRWNPQAVALVQEQTEQYIIGLLQDA